MSISDHIVAHPIAVVGDVVAALAVGGSFMGYLPDIAAGFGAFWYLVQFFESETGRRFVRWINSFRNRPPHP